MVALLVAAALSGCADDDGDDGAGDAAGDGAGLMDGDDMGGDGMERQVVQVTVSAEGIYPANPSLAPARLEVPANATVELTYINNDPNPVVVHDWFVEGIGAQTAQLGSGESTTISFETGAPGEFAYWCAVGDHRSAGMEGVLVVA